MAGNVDTAWGNVDSGIGMGLFVPVLRTDIVETVEFDGWRTLVGISNSEPSEVGGKLVLVGEFMSSELARKG